MTGARAARPPARSVFLLLSSAIGAGLALLLVAGLELLFSWRNEAAEQLATRHEGSYAHGFFLPDVRLGYRPRPSARVESTAKSGERVLYRVTYTVDERGRRVTPISPGGGRTFHALFLGCSFTFGEGVEDAETLPAAFGRHAPEYRPYNHGFCGYGPQSALAQLTDPGLPSGVAEPSGVAVYTYLVGHEARAVGSMRVVSSWGRNMPLYALDAEGRPVRVGSFGLSRPRVTAAYDLLARSETLRWLGVDVPLVRTASQYELTARILAACRDAYLASFPSGRFLVLVYPSRDEELAILPRLARLGVETLDLSRLFDPEGPGLSIEVDRHPTPPAYDRVARELASALSRPPGPGPRR